MDKKAPSDPAQDLHLDFHLLRLCRLLAPTFLLTPRTYHAQGLWPEASAAIIAAGLRAPEAVGGAALSEDNCATEQPLFGPQKKIAQKSTTQVPY